MATTIIIQDGGSGAGGGLFPPRGAAADFFAACVKTRPGTHDGSLFDFQDSLPYVSAALCLVANGMRNWIGNVAQDLPNMNRGMYDALTEVWRPLATAAKRSEGLPGDFLRHEAANVARRHQRGAQTANVRTHA